MKKIRVLVLAELCNPDWASVPLVGWKNVLHLSQRTDLTLVTKLENKPQIENQNPQFGRFYVDSPILDSLFYFIVKKFFGGGFGSATLTFVKIPFYLAFEFKAAWFLLRNSRRKRWQFVHRVTPVSPVLGSPIAIVSRLLGIPFVLGPVNGGLPWPPGYEDSSQEKSALTAIRSLYRFEPFVFLTRVFAARILAASKFTQSEIPKPFQGKTVYIPENGIEASLVENSRPRQGQAPLRLVFIGRLVPLKCPQVAIEAAWTFIEEGKATFDIFGDGPLMDDLSVRFQHPQVKFHGWIASQAELVSKLSAFDVLVFPSIKEFGGGVVIEAMAKGIVPIVMDYGGPGEIVNEGSGVKLPLSNEKQTCQEIRVVIAEFLEQGSRLESLSKGACQRILDFYTWEQKAKQIEEIYKELTHG